MTDLIVSFIHFLTDMVDSSVPTFDAGSSIVSTICSQVQAFCNFISAVNFMIPLTDIAQMLIVTASWELSKFVLFVANWIIRRIADVIP